jgi:hypothetical protein
MHRRMSEGTTMAAGEVSAVDAHYHRERARAERLAANRSRDPRARRAHLELARQHETAMFQSCAIVTGEEHGIAPSVIGANLRAVIALSADSDDPATPLEALMK